jgi:hypothetical protein
VQRELAGRVCAVTAKNGLPPLAATHILRQAAWHFDDYSSSKRAEELSLAIIDDFAVRERARTC